MYSTFGDSLKSSIPWKSDSSGLYPALVIKNLGKYTYFSHHDYFLAFGLIWSLVAILKQPLYYLDDCQSFHFHALGCFQYIPWVNFPGIGTVTPSFIGKYWRSYWHPLTSHHRWVLPVLRYPSNMVIYHYPLFWVILMVILLIFIIQNYPNFF